MDIVNRTRYLRCEMNGDNAVEFVKSIEYITINRNLQTCICNESIHIPAYNPYPGNGWTKMKVLSDCTHENSYCWVMDITRCGLYYHVSDINMSKLEG